MLPTCVNCITLLACCLYQATASSSGQLSTQQVAAFEGVIEALRKQEETEEELAVAQAKLEELQQGAVGEAEQQLQQQLAALNDQIQLQQQSMGMQGGKAGRTTAKSKR